MLVRMAKRVRDAEGGVSQCVACEAPQRSEARSSPTRRETPKKFNVLLSDCLGKMEWLLCKKSGHKSLCGQLGFALNDVALFWADLMPFGEMDILFGAYMLYYKKI